VVAAVEDGRGCRRVRRPDRDRHVQHSPDEGPRVRLRRRRARPVESGPGTP
jgi:hypothetical protein